MERENRAREVTAQREEAIVAADDTSKKVRLYFQDLVRYLLLLIFYQTALSMGPNGDPSKYDFLASYKRAYEVPLSNVDSYKTFWEFIEGPFINRTVPDEYYNGTKLPENMLGFALYSNFIIGDLRLRQTRTLVDTCMVPLMNLKDIGHCYIPYAPWFEDERAFGPSSEYKWFANGQDVGTTGVYGKLSTEYPETGHTVKIPKNATGARVVVANLKRDRWIDHQTRAAVASWTVYNPSQDMFINTQLLFEMPAFGGVYARGKFISFQPIRYYGDTMIVLVLEVVVIAIVCAALYREYTLLGGSKKSKDLGFDYDLKAYYDYIMNEDQWRIQDFINYLMCLSIFLVRMLEWTWSALIVYEPDTGTLAGLFNLYELNEVDVFMQAINASQMWFKSFKYICLFHTPSMFWEVSQCRPTPPRSVHRAS